MVSAITGYLAKVNPFQTPPLGEGNIRRANANSLQLVPTHLSACGFCFASSLKIPELLFAKSIPKLDTLRSIQLVFLQSAISLDFKAEGTPNPTRDTKAKILSGLSAFVGASAHAVALPPLYKRVGSAFLRDFTLSSHLGVLGRFSLPIGAAVGIPLLELGARALEDKYSFMAKTLRLSALLSGLFVLESICFNTEYSAELIDLGVEAVHASGIAALTASLNCLLFAKIANQTQR